MHNRNLHMKRCTKHDDRNKRRLNKKHIVCTYRSGAAEVVAAERYNIDDAHDTQ
jgi:hypothetical protein